MFPLEGHRDTGLDRALADSDAAAAEVEVQAHNGPVHFMAWTAKLLRGERTGRFRWRIAPGKRICGGEWADQLFGCGGKLRLHTDNGPNQRSF